MSNKLQFPNEFTFGVADADLQVIGEKHTQQIENTPETMWHHATKQKGMDTPADGIDRYHRWKEDVEILQKMGIKEYRTSISMARMLNKDGSVNAKAVEWYTVYFKALRKAGITIYATLFHWELPYFLHEQGGLTNPKTIDWLVKHTQAVHEHLGEFIEEYFLLNEPWSATILAHYLGIFAPFEKNLQQALLSAHNLLLAQGLMYKELQKHNVKISSVYNVIGYYAATEGAKDRLAASIGYGNVNAWFLDPLYRGTYPEDMLEIYGKAVPPHTKVDMDIINIGAKLHALGVNYYFSETVQYAQTAGLKFKPVLKKGGLTNGLNWPLSIPPIYTDGLYDILQQIYFSYKHHGLRKMYIAENGFAGDKTWDGKKNVIEDLDRIYYYQQHLRQVHQAILAGIPLEKYFLWTLMDNYEWQNGYTPNAAFGIIHVDRKTMKRVPKKSAQWYEEVVKTNTVLLR